MILRQCSSRFYAFPESPLQGEWDMDLFSAEGFQEMRRIVKNIVAESSRRV